VAPLPEAAFIPVALVTEVVAIAALTAAVASGDDGSAAPATVTPPAARAVATPGADAYRCGIHSSMTGTVVVEP
jgi:hypothetical protein